MYETDDSMLEDAEASNILYDRYSEEQLLLEGLHTDVAYLTPHLD